MIDRHRFHWFKIFVGFLSGFLLFVLFFGSLSKNRLVAMVAVQYVHSSSGTIVPFAPESEEVHRWFPRISGNVHTTNSSGRDLILPSNDTILQAKTFFCACLETRNTPLISLNRQLFSVARHCLEGTRNGNISYLFRCTSWGSLLFLRLFG